MFRLPSFRGGRSILLLVLVAVFPVASGFAADEEFEELKAKAEGGGKREFRGGLKTHG